MNRPPELPEFEKLRALAESDPGGFEERRRQLIESALARVPPDRRARMRGLQWRIDQERRRCDTPLAACISLSRMMWESVTGNRGLLDVLNNGNRTPRPPCAKVLPLSKRH